MVKMKVRGMEGLSRAILALPIRMRRKAVRPALQSAASIVRREIIQNAPVDTGVLKRSIRQKFKRATRFEEAVMVGVSQRAYYWKFLEFGTDRMAARPFIRPAFDRTSKETLTEFIRAARIGVGGG